MTIKLIDNWGTVLKKSWSVRFMALGAACAALELLFNILSDAYPSFKVKFYFGLAAIVCNFIGMWARTIKQPKMRGENDGGEQDT